MTIEITEFRCPTCGHVLGEEQYSIACEEVNRIVAERVKQGVEINNVQHRKEMQERERRNAAEIQSIVQQTLSKERVSIDLRHQEDLAEKDRQIEAVRSERDTYWEEKLDQAVAATVQGQAEKNSQFELKFHRVDERNRELMQDIEKLQRALDNVPSEFKGTSFENNVASQSLHGGGPSPPVPLVPPPSVPPEPPVLKPPVPPVSPVPLPEPDELLESVPLLVDPPESELPLLLPDWLVSENAIFAVVMRSARAANNTLNIISIFLISLFHLTLLRLAVAVELLVTSSRTNKQGEAGNLG